MQFAVHFTKHVHQYKLKHCAGGGYLAYTNQIHILYHQQLLLGKSSEPLPQIFHTKCNPSPAFLQLQGLRCSFFEVGMDFAGPFLVSRGHRMEKRYLHLVICCSTRCLNVEVCYNITAQSCLAALTWHIAKMGKLHKFR